MDWQLIPLFLAIGCIVGFLAGLLGVGGAVTMTPVLMIIFTRQGLPPEHIVHIAVATSLATIMFTSISSMRAHARRGAVLWRVVWALAPGIVLGSLVGPQIVAGMSSGLLAALFGVFTGVSAARMLMNLEPKPLRQLPGKAGLFGAGATIGVVSSMVGAGGAFLSVPFMTRCNVRIHNAVATSAALGFPIAAAGTRRGEHAGRTARSGARAPLAGDHAKARVRLSAVRDFGLYDVEGREPERRARIGFPICGTQDAPKPLYERGVA